jgi:hypothetical protein
MLEKCVKHFNVYTTSLLTHKFSDLMALQKLNRKIISLYCSTSNVSRIMR